MEDNSLTKMNRENPTRAGRVKFRYLVCSLGLAAMMISQMSRVVINFCITSMVDTSVILESHDVSSDEGSCPAPESRIVLNRSIRAINMSREAIDQSIIHEPYISRESEIYDGANYYQNFTDNIDYDKFKWTIKQQNLLLGGFYYSYFVVMILAGQLAEIYGPKKTILVAMSGSAVLNLATPWIARNSYELLVLSRIVMGSIQSCVFPSLYVLFSRWLTLTEASIFAPMLKLSIKSGTLLGSLVSGLLDRWADVFYTQGLIFVVYLLLWLIISSSHPDDNYWVSSKEVEHIKRKKKLEAAEMESQVDEGELEEIEQQEKSKSTNSTPWLRLFTCPSVIGLCLAKWTINCSADFIAIELPSYLKFVHHAPKETISLITSSIAVIQITFTVLFSWLAKVVVKKQPFGLSRTCIRRIFQGVANFGQFVCFMMMTFDTCNLIYVSILLQLAAFTMMSLSGGEPMVPFELSGEYMATIVAISNSAANVAGTSITIVTGYVLGDEGSNYKRWNTLFMLVAAANLIGGISFCTMVQSKPIDFNSSRKSSEKKNKDQTGDKKISVGEQV